MSAEAHRATSASREQKGIETTVRSLVHGGTCHHVLTRHALVLVAGVGAD